MAVKFYLLLVLAFLQMPTVRTCWVSVRRDFAALNLLSFTGQGLREVAAGLDVAVARVGADRRPVSGAALVGKRDSGNRLGRFVAVLGGENHAQWRKIFETILDAM